MGMRGLTLSEAAERARLVKVRNYAVDLDLTGDETGFGCTTVIRFSCRQPGASTFVEIRPAELRRAVLNGRELDPADLDDSRLPLDDLGADNELRVEAVMPYSRTGQGLHRFTDPADGEIYLTAQCGVDNAQRIFAAFDQPDLKAPIQVTATVPAGWTAVGNGRGRPEPGQPARWRFAATPPISTYLFTLVTGRLHSIVTEHGGVPFALHCRRSLARYLDQEAAELLGVTRACFDRYREIFDEPYPFDSYDQAFVPELDAGAMENPGCVTFRDEFVFQSAVTRAERQTRGMVIAHEMAHMWFGDLVTMSWWDDLWLSESFAEYMGFQVLSEATSFTGTWADFALGRKPRGYDADQRLSTHPVAPDRDEVPDMDAALSNYDDISYAKGASALRQLVAWIGRRAFRTGINAYLTQHRFGNATLSDLLDCLTRASGLDVHEWARHWLRSTGVDTLTVAAVQDRAAETAGHEVGGQLVIEHFGTRPHRLLAGIYDHWADEPGRLGLRASVPVSIDAATQRRVIPLPPGPRPALVLLNDGDLTYAKIRPDPRSWATVTSSLSSIGDPVARAVVWNTARDLVRDGELPALDYLELVARHLPAETDTAIAAHVLDFARAQVTDRYLDPASRRAALALITGACRELLANATHDTATPGPATPDTAARNIAAHDSTDGLALTAVRGLIDSAASPAEVADLRARLGDPGLTAELRWQALLRLTVLGEVGRVEIDQEHDREPSADGQQRAARCRAALPTCPAKQAAWATLFETGHAAGSGQGAGTELPAYLLTATAQGFWQPEQADLLAGYLPRYFPAVIRAADERGAAAARILVRHGFPAHAVDAATLAAGEQCLEHQTLAPGLRRLLADQLDDLRRALCARQVP
jgi:aminopeptidase N